MAISQDLIVTHQEARARHARRQDWGACEEAFLDCRIAGSDRKVNYALVGMGVAQNAGQVINIQGRHGFNLGAAAMPHGVVNNLHLHFSAEVFMCFRGEWTVRWGLDGQDGELCLREGDIVSVPTWIFRGFTNTGPDDGFLFTALGQDNTGGIVWAPSVIEAAARTGLHLTRENLLFDSVPTAGSVPDGVELIAPMKFVGLATTEDEAVQWLTANSNAWDLTIIDLVLHRGTGFGVLHACRARSAMQKVVVLTSYREEDMWQRCRELGADNVFDKSHQIEELVDFCRVHAVYLKFMAETNLLAEHLAEQRADL